MAFLTTTRAGFVVTLWVLLLLPETLLADAEPRFVRGDAQVNHARGLEDCITVLGYLFLRDPETIDCEKAADVNDDGRVDIGDVILLLVFLFLGETELPEPFSSCGVDPTPDSLSCQAYWVCGTGRFENSVGMTLLPLPPGEFLMGSPLSERGRFPDETPHFVELTCGLYMSETEVTQGQYEKLMGVNPSCFNGFWGGTYYGDVPNRAVDRVGWFDAVEFCNRLSKKENRRYRLPYEAEWEYACRAGTTTRFWFGDLLDCEDDWNWNSSNDCPPARPFMFLDNEEYGGVALPVGLKTANPWGFHDMYGHLSEWCQDWYGPYPTERVVNPTGPPNGTAKVIRGFSNFYMGMRWVRSACRGTRREPTDNYFCSIGFRVVLELPECPYGD